MHATPSSISEAPSAAACAPRTPRCVAVLVALALASAAVSARTRTGGGAVPLTPAAGGLVAGTGVIAGAVTDTTSLVLPGVTVEARPAAAGGPVRSAVTDGAGRFVIDMLPAGRYDVTFALAGFRPLMRAGVEVAAGAAVTLDAELSLLLEEQVVVVGSRARPRSVTESQVPIDAIGFADVASQGVTSLDYRLRTLVPSFNAPEHPLSGAATLVRPVTLRNLAHDHVLVLVNGKRRHRSAILPFFGGVTDGTQGPDISTIPAIALRQVEVLRDGASAQYGSDAIAGVMNFLLRDAREGGALQYSRGAYRAGDGDRYTVAGNVGLPLTDTGFVNLSLEYGNADPTDRSVQRADAKALIAAGNPAVADPAASLRPGFLPASPSVQVWGDPQLDDDLKLFGNFGRLFGNGVQVYGHANYAERDSTHGFYYRNPNTRANIFSLDGGRTLLVGDVLDARDGVPDGSANCPTVRITDHAPDPAALARVFDDPDCFSFQEIARGGFTPWFTGSLTDLSSVAGLRRTGDGLRWDLSGSYGSHRMSYSLHNTVNASLGPDTPRDFHPGRHRQEEVGLNFDVSHDATDRMHVAGGAEWRDERFTVGAGDPLSFEVGPYARQGFVSGSNGFAGFPEHTAGAWSRSNVALYGDVELQDPAARWTVGAALRFEHFDLFGSTTNGKLSARYRLGDAVAVRGGVSTGFRAPTPGQQNLFNVQSAIDPKTRDLVDSATVPSTFRAAQLRGGGPLDPETSTHATAGLVVDRGSFTLTADWFRIDVENRLAQSQDFTLTAGERALLLSEGIFSARTLAFFRFFVNDFATRTEGVDIVSSWAPAALGGGTLLSFALNHTDTDVTAASELLNPGDVLALERAAPDTRWNAAINQQMGRVGLLARLHYYGSWVDQFDARRIRLADAPVLGGRYILDLEAGIPLGGAVTLAVGGQNVLDTFPDPMALLGDTFGVPHSQYTPWGFSGGYYYARVEYRWGA